MYFNQSKKIPRPNKLVLYDLNLTIIKLIDSLNVIDKRVGILSKKYTKGIICGFWKEKVTFENKEYIGTTIEGYGGEYYEMQLFDLETFTFHPTYSKCFFSRY